MTAAVVPVDTAFVLEVICAVLLTVAVMSVVIVVVSSCTLARCSTALLLHASMTSAWRAAADSVSAVNGTASAVTDSAADDVVSAAGGASDLLAAGGDSNCSVWRMSSAPPLPCTTVAIMRCSSAISPVASVVAALADAVGGMPILAARTNN